VGEKKDTGTRSWWRWGLGVLMIGALLSAITVSSISASNDAKARRAVQKEAEALADMILERVTLYQYGLRGMRGIIHHLGSHHISRDAIIEYSKTRDIKIEFPGARGFGFIRRVAIEDEAVFLKNARSEGRPDFSIKQLTPHENERFVIQYIEPEETNKAAIGLDIASEARRREAAMAAIDTGEARLTAPITLVQASGDRLQSFLMLLPVYEGTGTPATIEARRVAAFGWSYAPLNMNEVLSYIAPNPNHLELDLRDINAAEEPFYSTKSKQSGSRVVHTINHPVLGRTWRISVAAPPSYLDAMNLVSPGTVGAGCTFVTLLSALLAAMIAQSHARRQQVLRTRERLSTIINNTADAVITEALDGTIMSWNKGAERLFGYSEADTLGKPLVTLLLSDDRLSEDATILARTVAGEATMAYDTRRLRSDGSVLDVSLSACPVHDDNGKIIGVAKLMQDISERVAAERRLLDMHHQLEMDVEARSIELGTTRRTLQMVLDSVPSLIGYWDRDLNCQLANHSLAQWLGTTHEALIGQNAKETLGKERLERNIGNIEAALRGVQQSYELTTPPDSQGTSRHFWISYIPDQQDDAVDGFYIVAHDITDIVDSRQKLTNVVRENKILLQTIDEQLLCSTTNKGGKILTINDNLCKVMGYNQEDLIGSSHKILSSGQHDRAFWADMWSTIMAGKTWRGEVCNRAKDGSLHWLDSVFTPIHGEDGAIERFLALRIDITERKRAEAERNRANVLLEKILESATETSIIATDPTGIITIFNSGAERMLGYDAGDMIGKQTPALFHVAEEVEQRGRELTAELGVQVEGFQVFVCKPEIDGAEAREWTYVRRDGTCVQVMLVVTAIRDEEGGILGYLGVAQDITQRKHAERHLRNAKEAAEAASVAKGQFLANMSHEIRTPMNAVLGMLTLVQRTALDSRQQDYVFKAHSAATSLLGLLNDILDLSKIEAGRLELDLHPFELDAILRDLAIVLAVSGKGQEVEMLFDISPNLPRAYIGDSLRLRQVLLNLGGNALKFTEQGQVVISISEVSPGPAETMLRMAVTDSGIGIERDKLTKIFDAFQQAESSTTRRFGGTGLGLAITQRLVEMMGGTLEVESELGNGSRFWFDIRLPVVDSAPAATMLDTTLRVLVVDDNLIAGTVLTNMLTGLGHQPTLVRNGVDALNQVMSTKGTAAAFDIVLMDWKMAGMVLSGVEK
jgi:PAS domain S-box-containing protein